MHVLRVPMEANFRGSVIRPNQRRFFIVCVTSLARLLRLPRFPHVKRFTVLPLD